MDVQVERRTFVGHDGRDEIALVCIRGDCYSILRNDIPIGVWGMIDFAYCMGIYLRMIDRTVRPPTPITQSLLFPPESGVFSISARAS
jgi:hypothetical protein